MPITLMMEEYLKHASDSDLEQTDWILEAIICAIDELRSEGVTGKQVTIAALSFARVMVLAQVEQVKSVLCLARPKQHGFLVFLSPKRPLITRNAKRCSDQCEQRAVPGYNWRQK